MSLDSDLGFEPMELSVDAASKAPLSRHQLSHLFYCLNKNTAPGGGRLSSMSSSYERLEGRRSSIVAVLMSTISKIKTVLWGPSSVERTLVIKLDSTILPYFSLIWFLFGVNRASYSHAYISGMKEDLGFQGKGQFGCLVNSLSMSEI